MSRGTLPAGTRTTVHPLIGNQVTEKQKQIGWEIAVRIEKILCTVLNEAHERQVEETMDTPSGVGGIIKFSSLTQNRRSTRSSSLTGTFSA
jgi:hypothetical protein